MSILIADQEVSERMFLRELLEGVARPVEVTQTFSMTESELLSRIRDVEVLVVGLAAVTAKVIERAGSLRLICKAGIGTDNIDLGAAASHHIPVTRASGVNAEGVAEHVAGCMIALLRNFLQADRGVRAGQWGELRRAWSGQMGEVRGRTLGIIGFGSIGQAVGGLASRMGMRVIAADPYVAAERAPAFAQMVKLGALYEEADFVSVNAVLTEETFHLVNEQAFRAMRSSAYLINTSRGPIVDQTALTRALKQGWISGCALDVFEDEPPALPDDFLQLPNVILSPHIAGCTQEGYREIGELVANQIRAYLAGGMVDPAYVVNANALNGGAEGEAR
jgi:D-3-phosphoglycerate dehydrogenase